MLQVQNPTNITDEIDARGVTVVLKGPSKWIQNQVVEYVSRTFVTSKFERIKILAALFLEKSIFPWFTLYSFGIDQMIGNAYMNEFYNSTFSLTQDQRRGRSGNMAPFFCFYFILFF